MFPLNDLSLKTQSVQLNKITSNTESTIKQHELVSDDAIINELSSELVSCLGNDKFTPVSEDCNLLNMLSEFKLLREQCFRWGNYTLLFENYEAYDKTGSITIEKNQGEGTLPIRHKLEFISTNIAELLDKLTKITDARLCKGFSDWASSVKEGGSNDLKENVDRALVRMFKCVKLHSNELDLSYLFLGSVPPLPDWIEMLSLVYNELDSIQVPESCKELELDFNNLTEFPQVPDGITLISVNNNLISHIDSFPPKAKKIFISHNKLSETPAIPDTAKVFDCGYNKIQEIRYFPKNLKEARIGYNNIEVVPAIPGNLKILFMECNPIKEAFLMPWTLTGICYEISQRKYIVTNPADYDKYSDMVKKHVIDGEELIIKY
ncbi:T3SS effector leucine-rich repeat protein EspR4, partial [Escherichia coli]|nr:T3SS effector leucine-rich repeat protein EspR4 [Escherichia coli]HAZ1851865.1 T3SS effector leucine-rich repeat protein EspR4 [Escherichia coli O157]EEW6266856.1 T3SS effector leucine-rich repeat protein EspR4 [Escherichia coli]EFA1488322.1 T3SS effector leucine-rich repeat protein EspR4 [Escherichia coli]EFD9785688.1 T3SS effector leucine-rich repeat protein EspR4 [Escherichia coli]